MSKKSCQWVSWLGSVRATASPSLLIFNKHGSLVPHFSFRQIGLQHFIPIPSFARQTPLAAAEGSVPSWGTVPLPGGTSWSCHPTRALPSGQERATGPRGGSLQKKPNPKCSFLVKKDPDEDTRPAWILCPLLPLPTPGTQPIPIPGLPTWECKLDSHWGITCRNQ